MASSPTPTPTLGTLLRHLLDLLDGDVNEVYARAGLDYRPRYTPIVRALIQMRCGSIRAIALHAGLTHSAASQTVAQMAKAGLLVLQPGEDARERVVSLSRKTISIVPALQSIWATTNAAASELDNELPYALSQLVEEAIHALERRPFGERMKRISLRRRPAGVRS